MKIGISYTTITNTTITNTTSTENTGGMEGMGNLLKIFSRSWKREGEGESGRGQPISWAAIRQEEKEEEEAVIGFTPDVSPYTPSFMLMMTHRILKVRREEEEKSERRADAPYPKGMKRREEEGKGREE